MSNRALTFHVLVVIFLIAVVLTYATDAKSRVHKRSLQKIHKFFDDDDEYKNSWDTDSFGGTDDDYKLMSENDDSFANDVINGMQSAETTTSTTATTTTITTTTASTRHPTTTTFENESQENGSDETKSVEKNLKMIESPARLEANGRFLQKARDEKKQHSATDGISVTNFDGGCKNRHCRLGRVCQTNADGRSDCVCAGADHCPFGRDVSRTGRRGAGQASRRSVCGSDGHHYSSHCEMHRQACIQRVHIRANADRSACLHLKDIKDGDEDDDDDDEHDDESYEYSQHHTVKKASVTDTSSSESSEEGKLVLKSPQTPTKRPALTVDTIVANVDRDVKFFKTSVVAGSGLEIKCDDLLEKLDSSSVTLLTHWTRNGQPLVDLVDDDIQVFADGSLYFNQVELYHIGNYSCEHVTVDGRSSGIQTHLLAVTMPPIAKVNPVTQEHMPGATVSVKCQSVGLPDSEYKWHLSNNDSTPAEIPHLLLQNGRTIQIQNVETSMDGTRLTCTAENSAGTSEAISVAYVKSTATGDAQAISGETTPEEVYIVFHSDGYTVYEPSHCHIMHVVFTDYLLPADSAATSLVPTLCEDRGLCLWGGAVRVENKFVYASQPKLNRVIVIELTDRFNPVEVIGTDRWPVDISYVQHLDQIWILCQNEDNDNANIRSELNHREWLNSSKTSVIIRQASVASLVHRAVHIQPLSVGAVETIQPTLLRKMFLPPNLADARVKPKYGYAAVMKTESSRMRSLYKIDLAALKIVKEISLQCVPTALTFIATGGKMVVSCEENEYVDENKLRARVLILDYITDGIITDSSVRLSGITHVSPDIRLLVTVEHDRVLIYRILDNGDFKLIMSHSIDTTYDQVIDLTFVPAATALEIDYDVFIRFTNSTVRLDVEARQTINIDGVEDETFTKKLSEKSREAKMKENISKKSVMESAGPFSDYLMSTADDDSVIIVDTKRHRAQCKWHGVTDVGAIIGVMLH